MSGFEQLLADPRVAAALDWVRATVVTQLEIYPVRAGVQLILDKMVRYGCSTLGYESPETLAKAFLRLRPFGERLAKKLDAAAERGEVTAESVRETFESPEGVRVINAAMSAVILTDDELTIDTLAAMVAEVARAGSGTRLSLHIRQAAAALEMLQPRQLSVLAQVLLAVEVPVPGNIWVGDCELDPAIRIGHFDDWAAAALLAVGAAQVRPRFEDLVELEAQGLILRSNDARKFETRSRPSGSTVVQRLAQGGAVGIALPQSAIALRELERLEFGETNDLPSGFRDLGLPALGSHLLTGAGYVLATTMMRERGVGVGINLNVWANDRGLMGDGSPAVSSAD